MDRKVVGIVTFHDTCNYGASLQAFALEHYLQEQGCDAFVIDYKSNISKHYRVLFPMFRKNLIRYAKQFIYNIRNYRENKNRSDEFKNFTEEYIKLSKTTYNSINQLKANYPKADLYITGSDQVWNHKLIGKLDPAYFLDFGDEKTKRISYAASLGSGTVAKEDEADFKRYLSNFDAISVREKEAEISLKNIVGDRVTTVTDPVFLLTKQEWETKLPLQQKQNEKYIFVYAVTNNEKIYEFAEKCSKKLGIKIKTVENEKDTVGGPILFTKLIHNAELVISNSFHATALSMIFEKNFYVIPHETYNARIDNLLNLAHLENRQVSADADLAEVSLTAGTKMGATLANEIVKSKNYLLDMIRQ